MKPKKKDNLNKILLGILIINILLTSIVIMKFHNEPNETNLTFTTLKFNSSLVTYPVPAFGIVCSGNYTTKVNSTFIGCVLK